GGDDQQQRAGTHRPRTRRRIAGGQKSYRHGDDDCDQGPKSRDVDGVPKRADEFCKITERGRNHAIADIGGLSRRIPNECPNGVLGHHSPTKHKEADEREPTQPKRELVLRRPTTPNGSIGGADNRHSYFTHLRTKPEEYSAAITMAMMRIKIAAAESYS